MVPLTEALPNAPYYDGSPAVRIRDWAHLPRTFERLLADRSHWDSDTKAALALWEQRCSPAAVASSIANAFGGAEEQALQR